jgi:hypothetical protein
MPTESHTIPTSSSLTTGQPTATEVPRRDESVLLAIMMEKDRGPGLFSDTLEQMVNRPFQPKDFAELFPDGCPSNLSSPSFDAVRAEVISVRNDYARASAKVGPLLETTRSLLSGLRNPTSQDGDDEKIKRTKLRKQQVQQLHDVGWHFHASSLRPRCLRSLADTLQRDTVAYHQEVIAACTALQEHTYALSHTVDTRADALYKRSMKDEPTSSSTQSAQRYADESDQESDDGEEPTQGSFIHSTFVPEDVTTGGIFNRARSSHPIW